MTPHCHICERSPGQPCPHCIAGVYATVGKGKKARQVACDACGATGIVRVEATRDDLFAAAKETAAPGPKLVLADRLDEIGEADLAHACRWLAGRGLHPHYRERYPNDGSRVPLAYRWVWRPIRLESWQRSNANFPNHAALPMLAFFAMAGLAKQSLHGTFEQAIIAVSNALATLKKEYQA